MLGEGWRGSRTGLFQQNSGVSGWRSALQTAPDHLSPIPSDSFATGGLPSLRSAE
jgi:hypothetical protein